MTTHFITLVGCCAEKLGRIAPARQMYRSELFRKASIWAEQQGNQWFVLSAAHGLIGPDYVIQPYDRSMRDMSALENVNGDYHVADQLEGHAAFHDADRLEITLLAGQSYAGWIPLVSSWCAVHQPLAGMQIGQRLQWLKQQIEGGPAADAVTAVCRAPC